jgi:hypothetical protein
MTTTKFIILATSVIAGSAAYWLTHRRKNTSTEDNGAPYARKERHYSPVFSHFKKPGYVPN